VGKIVGWFLVHFLNCKSRGVLVAPFWPPSLFWPYLIQGNGAFKSFVVAFLFVQNGRDAFVRGGNVRVVFETGQYCDIASPLGLGSCFIVVVHWGYGV